MKFCKFLCILPVFCAVLVPGVSFAAEAPPEMADFIIRNAKVITVDSKFAIAQAIAVKGDRILAVGKNKEISRYAGPITRIIEAQGKVVMPGLYDSHVH